MRCDGCVGVQEGSEVDEVQFGCVGVQEGSEVDEVRWMCRRTGGLRGG